MINPNVITLGIGPQSDIPHFILLGLAGRAMMATPASRIASAAIENRVASAVPENRIASAPLSDRSN